MFLRRGFLFALLLCRFHVGAADLPDSSLYQLRSTWSSDLGEPVKLESLRGKPRLLTLFFGHCESTCPMVVGGLKRLDAALPTGWGKSGGIVLVTLDPRRDDSGSLADYRKRMELPPDRWTLLRGGETDTRELAMALGVAYRRSTKNGGMEHDAMVVLLGADGRVLRRYQGADADSAMAKDFRAALGLAPR